MSQMLISNIFLPDIHYQEYGPILRRNLGLTGYKEVWHAMQAFTLNRTADTPDEIWITEHAPVYTLGLNRRGASLPLRSDIPIIETDRGGKITYHGPGQVIIYFLLNMTRMQMTIQQLVSYMETTLISMLKIYGITGKTIQNAPGVYVDGRKIASLGLRVKKNCCYHGFSLNVDMDLSPFLAIDPCGYRGLQMTQMRDLGVQTSVSDLGWHLSELLIRH